MLLLPATAGAQPQPAPRDGTHWDVAHRHHLAVFPIVAFLGIYSAQHGCRRSPKNELIVGFTYVNIEVSDREDRVIGRFHAPTLPLGFRRYLWRNAHIEYQLWPAYNFYYDKQGERYHNGFDLYNEARAGYRIDFSLGQVPLFANASTSTASASTPATSPQLPRGRRRPAGLPRAVALDRAWILTRPRESRTTYRWRFRSGARFQSEVRHPASGMSAKPERPGTAAG